MTLNFTPVILFILIGFTCAFGQEKEFLDKEGNKTQENKAEYYRIATRDKDGRLAGTVDEYYLSGELRKTSTYKDGTLEGRQVVYYANGQPEQEQNFENGRLTGSVQSWYSNGQSKEKGWAEIKEKPGQGPYGKMSVYKIESYSDSTGKIWVDKGNGEYIDYHPQASIRQKGIYTNGYKQGLWVEYNSDGRLIHSEQFDKGELIEGTRYEEDGSAYKYVVLETMPEYQGGIPGLMNFLIANVKYPKKSRKQGIEGTVFVNFIVDQTGQVTDINVVKGIGEECDAESMRVVRLMPRWKPGIQRGKAIPVRFTLPIRFKLS
jgi:TonB family protein